MSSLSNARVAYFNGRWVPEREVMVPFRDRSFTLGDGCFDMTRTFHGKPFKVTEHIERFYRTLKYLQIDAGMPATKMCELTEEAVERNKHLLGPEDDYWVAQRVTRGVDAVGDEGWEETGPTVIVECKPLPFKVRAHLYREGIEVMTPSTRRTPPNSLSPRGKTHNYLNLIMGDLEVQAQNPKAWAVLLDLNGNLCEGKGSNIFVVKDGEIRTPKERYVLGGISRETVMELAAGMGTTVEQDDLDLYDAYNADEVFLSSTSLCLCGVAKVNGVQIGDGAFPGPITKRLLEAYSDLVGVDIERQYLSRSG